MARFPAPSVARAVRGWSGRRWRGQFGPTDSRAWLGLAWLARPVTPVPVPEAFQGCCCWLVGAAHSSERAGQREHLTSSFFRPSRGEARRGEASCVRQRAEGRSLHISPATGDERASELTSPALSPVPHKLPSLLASVGLLASGPRFAALSRISSTWLLRARVCLRARRCELNHSSSAGTLQQRRLKSSLQLEGTLSLQPAAACSCCCCCCGCIA